MAPNRKIQTKTPAKKVVVAPSEPAERHKIGYARVSMADQDPRFQIDALLAAGVDERDIYRENASGATTNRPQFQAMMKDVREGDVVYVWKLDRLGRSAMDLYQTAEEIRQRGADLVVLTMQGMDTRTLVGRAMFGMLSVFAEFERGIALERTMAGLAAARARGNVGGRRSQFTDAQVLEAAKLGIKPGARHLKMSVAGFRHRLAKAKESQNVES